jgi:hypothetical protein
MEIFLNFALKAPKGNILKLQGIKKFCLVPLGVAPFGAGGSCPDPLMLSLFKEPCYEMSSLHRLSYDVVINTTILLMHPLF